MLKRFLVSFLLVALSIVSVSGSGIAQEESAPITPENIGNLGIQATIGHGRVCSVTWSLDGRFFNEDRRKITVF